MVYSEVPYEIEKITSTYEAEFSFEILFKIASIKGYIVKFQIRMCKTQTKL